MLDNPHQDPDQDQVGASFIGSFPDGPDHALIVLSGDIDAPVLARLDVHIDDVLATRPRFVTIDASAVTRCDPDLLDLLGHTQRRLARIRGLLSVRGLHPHLLPAEAALATDSSPAPPRPGSDARVPLAALTRAARARQTPAAHNRIGWR